MTMKPEHARKVAEELLSDEEIMVFADDTHLVSDDSFETYKPYLKAFTAKALAAALVKLTQGEPVAIVALDYNRSQEGFEPDGRLNGVDWLTPSTMNEKLVPAGTLLFTHPALSQQDTSSQAAKLLTTFANRCPDCFGSEFPGFIRGLRCRKCGGTQIIEPDDGIKGEAS